MFDPAVIAAFESQNIGTRIFLVELFLDSGPLYYTTATEDKQFNGNTYIPLGQLGSFSEVKETNDIEPAEYNLTIGSVDPAIIQLLLGQNILNRDCSVYNALINDDQTFIGDPWLYFKGRLQPASINDGKGPVIQIPVRDILADWDRNIDSRYTDAEQRRLHPDDFCFEFVSTIAGAEITWPASSFWE
jgi:hypothetical protein